MDARDGRGRRPRGERGGGGEGWLVVSVLAPPPGQELLAVDALRRTGARAVERVGDRFVAHFPPPRRSVDTLVRDVELALVASTTGGEPGLVWHWESADEWAERWCRENPPVRVTERITVAAAGAGGGGGASAGAAAGGDAGAGAAGDPDAHAGGVTRPGSARDAVIIRLDPAAAFGTAEHATTRACLRALERRIRPGDRVLDIGTGSGVLAIAAALLGAGRVIGVEADPLSCQAARKNVARNGVADRVAIVALEAAPGRIGPAAAPGAAAGPGAPASYDAILANLEAHLVTAILPDIRGALAEGGWAVVSGIVRNERDDVVAAAHDAGLALVAEERERGWWTGTLRPGVEVD